LILAGRCGEALAVIEEGLAIMRQTSASLSLAAEFEMLRARIFLEQGDAARAEQLAGALSTNSFYGSFMLRLLRARIAIARDARAERDQIASLLDGVARDLAAASLLFRAPEVHEVRADLARALADEAGRARELGEAQRLYAEMGAAGHVERIARLLAAAPR
jgi:hypothetical protein